MAREIGEAKARRTVEVDASLLALLLKKVERIEARLDSLSGEEKE